MATNTTDITNQQDSSPVCGVALYTIENGKLDGSWTSQDPKYEAKICREEAIKTKSGKDNLMGEYKLTVWVPNNDNPVGSGTLNITALSPSSEDTYELSWSYDHNKQFKGVGIRVGKQLAASFFEIR